MSNDIPLWVTEGVKMVRDHPEMGRNTCSYINEALHANDELVADIMESVSATFCPWGYSKTPYGVVQYCKFINDLHQNRMDEQIEEQEARRKEAW